MKVGVRSFLIVGIMAVLFIVIFKVLANKYPVGGVDQVANAI